MANTVNNQLAGGILNQFHVSIGLNLQRKLNDWSGRQDLQYESMKGLMNKDWHSLADFNWEMGIYSSCTSILRWPWQAIKSIVPNNLKMLATLITIPAFGPHPLGSSVLSLIGVQNIVVAPQDILKNQSQFNATISSVA